MQKIKFSALVFSYFFLSSFCSGQEKDSLSMGEYSFVLTGGFGITYFSTTAGVAQDVETKLSRSGYAGTLRLTWLPDHKINFGFETGRNSFYDYTISDGIKEGKVRLSAIPLLFEFSMPITKHISAYTGAGIYLITTHLDYEGTVNSHSQSLGWMVAGSYAEPLSENISLSAEVKWLNATEHQLGVVALQLLLAWRFYKW